MERRIAELQEFGYPALGKLNGWLSGRGWLVGDRYSIADLGVFLYVEMAPQGGYDMGRFSAIAWPDTIAFKMRRPLSPRTSEMTEASLMLGSSSAE